MIDQRVHDWAFENSPIFEGWVCDGASESEVFRRVKDMRHRIPAEWTSEIEDHFKEVVKRVIQTVMEDRNGPSVMMPSITVHAPITLNSTTISDNTNCTFNLAASGEKAPAKEIHRVINWRRIDDDRLNFNERIIFSILWGWAYRNGKKRKHKALTNYRIHKATGFRLSVIAKVVAKLKELGYLDDRLQPLITKHDKQYTLKNGAKLLKGYTKVEWRTTDDQKHDLRQIVAQAVLRDTNKHVRAGWLVKALGVSRRTAYSYMGTGDGLHSVVTDCTAKK